MLRLGSYIVRSYERTNSFRKGDNYIMKYTTWGNPYTHSQYSRTTYQKKDLAVYRRGYGVCTWCGNAKHTLYRYNDAEPIKLMGQFVKLYCNRSCYDSIADIDKCSPLL